MLSIIPEPRSIENGKHCTRKVAAEMKLKVMFLHIVLISDSHMRSFTKEILKEGFYYYWYTIIIQQTIS